MSGLSSVLQADLEIGCSIFLNETQNVVDCVDSLLTTSDVNSGQVNKQQVQFLAAEILSLASGKDDSSTKRKCIFGPRFIQICKFRKSQLSKNG